MALVRVSIQLMADVEEGVVSFGHKIYEEQIIPICKETATGEVHGGSLAEWVETKLWEEYPHLRTLVPNDWCTNVHYVVVEFENKNFTLTVRKALGDDFRAPPNSDRYGQRLTFDGGDDFPWLANYRRTRAAYVKAKAEHDIKYGQLQNQIVTFLKSSKSLNDALKRYPDLRLWVPQNYLMRVDETAVSERKLLKPVADQPEIDTNLITSLGVLKQLKSS